MIVWLAPLFLLGLAGLAVPILLHLRRRRMEKRVAFGAMMFLEESPPPPKQRRRLEDWWLLLLRCLALALVVLAFAWPAWRSVSDAAQGEQRRVILIDRSASMQGEPMEEAKALARSLGGEAFWTFDGTAQEVVDLEQVKAGAASGSPLEAVERVLLDLEEEEGAEIHLISDFQRGNRPETLTDLMLPRGVAVRLHRVGVDVAPEPYLQAVGGSREVEGGREWTVLVANPGPEQVELVLELSTGTQEPVTLEAGEQRVVPLVVPAEQRELEVNLAGRDGIGTRTWFAEPRQPEVTVAWLSEAASNDVSGPTFYLTRALRTPGPFRVRIEETVDQASVVLVNRTLTAEETALGEKAAVVLLPRDGAMLESFAPFVPGLQQVGEADVPERGWRMTRIRYDDPMFAPFREVPYADFSKIAFWRARTAEFSGGEVVAGFAGGEPAIVRFDGEQRVWLWLSTWEPIDSQLARSTKFVPLLYSLIEEAAEVRGGRGVFPVGEPIPAGWPGEGERLEEPGITRDAEGAPQFVGLVPMEELDGSRLTSEEVEALEAVWDSGVATDQESFFALRESMRSYDWWRWCILVAGLLLLAETWLAGQKPRGRMKEAQ